MSKSTGSEPISHNQRSLAKRNEQARISAYVDNQREKRRWDFLRFKLEGKDLEGLATPYNRFEIEGFINGGKTKGGMPEFVIPNRPIKALNYELELLD